MEQYSRLREYTGKVNGLRDGETKRTDGAIKRHRKDMSG